MMSSRVEAGRTAGILLHPTSLPGPYGIGDLGPQARAWLDGLYRAGQTWWQVLPLGPTGYGNSPYQSFSAFAGNPVLVSPDQLVEDGLLDRADLPGEPFDEQRVDFDRVIAMKAGLLGRARERFEARRRSPLHQAFAAFREEKASWLNDQALFMALKQAHDGAPWWLWSADLRLRRPAALAQARRELAGAIDLQQFAQFLFHQQWQALRRHASTCGVRIVGDLPIYVAEDSADVWANRELFQLDAAGRPTAVAGVPPDYFSVTGQLWGNPLYAWQTHADSGFAWWIDRVRDVLGMVDLIRLDHFRGLEAYWAVPAGEPTAENGRWEPGPGGALLQALRQALGGLPLIAEDLGFITPEVRALREAFALPGMRILQFAFGGAIEERFLPHAYEANTVVYTGTHDNDTTAGWLAGLTAAERTFFRRYVPPTADGPIWDLIRTAWASVADHAVVPLQDLLELDSTARMNRPGIASDNWGWRVRAETLARAPLDRLRELTETYRRNGTPLAPSSKRPSVTPGGPPAPSPGV